MTNSVVIIGGGLAGCEAAYQIAKRKIKVKLYEMKPKKFSPAHSNCNLAEIVCSNSFKSNLLTNACGLLKEELRILDSLLIKIADETNVPAGQALAVDREKFSERVTKEIRNNPFIEIVNDEIVSKYDEENNFKKDVIFLEDLIEKNIVIIATGPLTSDSLSMGIKHLTGEEGLHFYDASAPIIENESIDFDIAFYGNRYDQERKKDESLEDWHKRIKTYKKEKQNINNQDKEKEVLNCKEITNQNVAIERINTNSYINLPMTKEEYEKFYNALINAQVTELHDFEKKEIFEGCMPIEVMAKRGEDTLRFGPLKPVGFDDPRTGKRPYAVVQLRQDDSEASLYNIVGFQTNLKFGEQKKVIQMIPGLKNAEIIKYGVMHRNTFINSPQLLDNTYNLKLKYYFNNIKDSDKYNENNKQSNVYFAGQITGVEGYVESISSGMVVGINVVRKITNIYSNANDKNTDISNKSSKIKSKKNENIVFSKETMIGALANYISTSNEKFQPMNANFGILPPLEYEIKDKKERYQKFAERALLQIHKK